MFNHDRPSSASRKLIAAWVGAAEASLRATFQVQSASLVAGRSLFEQWEAALDLGQQAVLDALHARRPSASHSTESV
jgi:hypothetical protein